MMFLRYFLVTTYAVFLESRVPKWGCALYTGKYRIGGILVEMVDTGASTNAIDKHVWSKMKRLSVCLRRVTRSFILMVASSN